MTTRKNHNQRRSSRSRLKTSGRRNKSSPNDSHMQAPPPSSVAALMSDIELELQQQRARKKALSENKVQALPVAPEVQLGIYRYDPERKAHFPQQTFPEPGNHQTNMIQTYFDKRPQQHLVMHKIKSVTGISIPLIGPGLELCTKSHQRRNLSLFWYGRLLAHSGCIVPSMMQEYSGRWVSMLPPLNEFKNGSTIMPHDLVIKSNLPPSTRTFDVLNDGTMVTLVQGGFFIRQGQQPRTWTERDYETLSWKNTTTTIHSQQQVGHAIRFVSPQLIVARNAKEDRQLDFYRHVGDNSNTSDDWRKCWTVESKCSGVHDFVLWNDAIVAFAPRVDRHTTYVTLFHDIYKETSTHMERECFGSSDSLCVESVGQTIVHGHRNGGLTLIDQKCPTPIAKTDGDSKGSITGLLTLDHRILAKRSFGTVSLYDMRMLTRCQELVIPSDMVHPTMSSCCVGMALDPTKQLVIAPYSDAQQQVHLAMWSLQNGTMVGTKQISLHKADGLPHLELRNTITPACDWTNGPNGKIVVTQPKGRWGLWYKSGMIEPLAPNYMGSIHHMHFTG